MSLTSNESVKKWRARLLLKSKATDRQHFGLLRLYFTRHLSKTYRDIQTWLDEVRAQTKPDEDETIRRRWGEDIEAFVTSYTRPNGKKMTFKSRKAVFTAIHSFLAYTLGEKRLGDYTAQLVTSEERLMETKEKEETPPVTVDEYKRLVLATRGRDNAILLTLPAMGSLSGCSSLVSGGNTRSRYGTRKCRLWSGSHAPRPVRPTRLTSQFERERLDSTT